MVSIKRSSRLLLNGAVAVLIAAANPAAAQMDVSFIPSDAVGAVIVRPREVLTSPQAKLLPTEVLSAIGKQQAGIDPLDIEQAVIVVDKFRNPQQPPEFGAIIRLTKPYQQAQILPVMFQGAQPAQAGGKTYLKGMAAPLNALHMPDERTVLLATEPMMQQMLAVSQPAGHLPTLLQRTNLDHHVTAILSVDAMRAEVNAMVAQAQQAPPPFNQFLKIPEHTSAVALRTSLADQFKLELILLGRDESSAQELERLVALAVAMGKEAAVNAATQEMQKNDPNDPVQQATLQYARRMADHYAQMLQPTRSGRAVTVAVQQDSNSAAMAIAMASLLPALQSAGGAATASRSGNNLRQIALAIHNYHDTYREFPTDITDAQGNRLLSWRVRLLPFVEEGPLYERFRLNEPWDSKHNMQLLAEMPETLKNPLVADPVATVYVAPRGEGTFWGDGKSKLSFRDILDGTSNTIMVVEANADHAVPWTKPADLEIDFQNPGAGLGDLRATGFMAVMGDGSTRTVAKTTAANILQALFTRAGGEVVPLP